MNNGGQLCCTCIRSPMREAIAGGRGGRGGRADVSAAQSSPRGRGSCQGDRKGHKHGEYREGVIPSFWILVYRITLFRKKEKNIHYEKSRKLSRYKQIWQPFRTDTHTTPQDKSTVCIYFQQLHFCFSKHNATALMDDHRNPRRRVPTLLFFSLSLCFFFYFFPPSHICVVTGGRKWTLVLVYYPLQCSV